VGLLPPLFYHTIPLQLYPELEPRTATCASETNHCYTQEAPLFSQKEDAENWQIQVLRPSYSCVWNFCHIIGQNLAKVEKPTTAEKAHGTTGHPGSSTY
jgi:hypothetical protein